MSAAIGQHIQYNVIFGTIVMCESVFLAFSVQILILSLEFLNIYIPMLMRMSSKSRPGLRFGSIISTLAKLLSLNLASMPLDQTAQAKDAS